MSCYVAEYRGFGSKMSFTPEQLLVMERQRQSPDYMIPRLEAQLDQQRAKLAETEALDPSLPYRANNILSYQNQIKSTLAQIARFEAMRSGAGSSTIQAEVLPVLTVEPGPPGQRVGQRFSLQSIPWWGWAAIGVIAWQMFGGRR